MVSRLPALEDGLDQLREVGGYVACQSASVTDGRPGEGGRTVVEKARGDAGLVFPLDDGRELSGDSRRRVGSWGEGARWTGELGREGLDLRVPLLSEDDDECGDWAYGLSLAELDDSCVRRVGGGRWPASRLRG
jgi:hypothetical protein